MKRTTLKLMASMLSLIMVGSMFAACSGNKSGKSSEDNEAKASAVDSEQGSEQGNEGDEEQEAAAEPATGEANRVIVGTNNQPDGYILYGWTNPVPNAQVRELVFASTMGRDQDGKNVINKNFAEDIKQTEDADGNVVFTTTINPEAKFNDGTPITVDDYLCNYLLSSSNAMSEIDNYNIATSSIYLGFEEWKKDNTKPWKGIRKIDDKTFSVTINKEEISYYITDEAAATAWPKKVLLPDVEIKDDGEGCYFSKPVTKAMLSTISDKDTGYRTNPKVTTGPYSFESFDSSTLTILLKRNPNFPGTIENKKPRIETIIYRFVPQDTILDELGTGGIDVVTDMNGGPMIKQGLKLVEDSKGKLKFLDYPRCGFGKINFVCDFGPTQFEKVRQAIAHLLDRQTFLQQYTGGYGVMVNGKYGQSQWEYRENRDALESELNQYPYSIDQAKKLLIEDGWTKNKDGGDYVEGQGLRYKEVDGKLMPLRIEWLNTPGNPVSELLNTMLPSAFEQVGAELVPTTQDFNVLIKELYRQGIEEPKYNMFNMGSTFPAGRTYSWYEYSTDPEMLGQWNTNYIMDKKLEEAANTLRKSRTEQEWSKNWLNFQKEWNRALPDLPLYSDQFYTFYNSRLHDFEPTALWDIGQALVPAYMAK